MKVLITGASGFVGKYMVEFLGNHNIEVIPTVRSGDGLQGSHIEMDVMDSQQTERILSDYRPTHIIHLAGKSSVRESWINKEDYISINTIGTMRLLDAVRNSRSSCRVLSVGSSEEYGGADNTKLPVREDNCLRPMSPYGVSKVSAGMLAIQYAKAYQMDVIHVRTFNHIGPKQNLGFVTQDFAKQIADIEKDLREPIIKVGNLDAIRDFTDVRDIVKAYLAVLENGKTGEVYNVCSGEGVPIHSILDQLITMSNKLVRIEVDQSKLRPSDVPSLIGDNTKLIMDTGWRRNISLSDTLFDILNYYRSMEAPNGKSDDL